MTRRLLFAILALCGLAFLLVHSGAHAQTLSQQQSAAYSATNAQTIKVATGRSTATIYVMQYLLSASAAGTVQIEYGTGSTCGTGTVNITGALQIAAGGNVQAGNGGGTLFVVPPGNDVCIASTGTASFAGHISFLQY
jgi:hypothetical protein